MKMKEAAGRERNNGGNDNLRSEAEKEWTKMREKQRRSITTKIFQGLRKHGGYHLSPRADNNQVLRHLAQEAGWVIEPDGTTYRSATTTSSGINVCPFFGGGRKRATPTPISSFIGANGGGRECATTASPRRISIKGSSLNLGGGRTSSLHQSSISLPLCGGFGSSSSSIAETAKSSSCPSYCDDTLMAIYSYGSLHKPSPPLTPPLPISTRRLDCCLIAVLKIHPKTFLFWIVRLIPKNSRPGERSETRRRSSPYLVNKLGQM